MRLATLVIVTAPLLTLTLGCGSRVPLGQVDGTVRTGGQPLTNVVVTFVPDSKDQTTSMRSMAKTDSQGKFRLRTEKQQDGAAVGQHRITVEDLSILSAPRSPDGTVLKRPPVRFSPDYSDLLKTPLQREVKSGSQTIDLDL